MDDFFDIISEFDHDMRGKPVDELPLASAYVPIQKWRDIYDADVGLSRGTIFFELDLPFLGKRAID